MNPLLRKLLEWLVFVACVGVFAFAGPAMAVPDDTLGPGDTIRITVFENPDLTTEGRLSSRGLIRFPMLGNVKLDGLTPGAAGERIAALLRDGNFIRDPQVSLAVIQVRSRQVAVLGQVARPGRYPLDETRTLLTDMLAQAGGITATGDEIVTLVRTRDGAAEKKEIDLARIYRSGDVSHNVELENGDTVFVRRAPVFYIYGQVQRAGTYRLENEMNVMQALSLSGGLTPYGTERGIKVARRAADGSLNKREVQLADQVQADDIIYVQESFF